MSKRANVLATHVDPSCDPALFRIAPEVQRTLQRGGPVVALESTIISHGMPYPENVECAKMLEAIVREGGAVPATIAILDGIIHVGLEPPQLELLGKEGRRCIKCSRRDMPYVTATRKNGATTVATTILIAHKVGIKVMATGGIGGVHKHGEVTMDVSADLTELGKTPVMVVCAGVKSILDIPRTLEYLETQGVSVAAYQSKEFPAFFTRHSGSEAPLSIDNTDDCAMMVENLSRLNHGSAIVLAVPIPAEHEADGAVVERAIGVALQETVDKKVEGRNVTPYVLQRVNELTKGASLKSNIQLVKNNARIASEIAVKRSKLSRA